MKMFEDMMKKIMGGMMKPDDMPEMMTVMMDRCFSEMKPNDKNGIYGEHDAQMYEYDA